MKKAWFCSLAIFCSIAIGAGSNVEAQTLPMWKGAKIKNIYADPGAMVLELDSAGPCGSNFYHIEKSLANFQEFTALMMTAASQGKTVNLYIVSCAGQRNILSHGGVLFQ